MRSSLIFLLFLPLFPLLSLASATLRTTTPTTDVEDREGNSKAAGINSTVLPMTTATTSTADDSDYQPGWIEHLVKTLYERLEKHKELHPNHARKLEQKRKRRRNRAKRTRKQRNFNSTSAPLASSSAASNRAAAAAGADQQRPRHEQATAATATTLNRKTRYIYQGPSGGAGDFTKLENKPQLRTLNHKRTGRFLAIHNNGTVGLVERPGNTGVLLFVANPTKRKHKSMSNVILRMYSPASHLFLAMQKKGHLYGTPNPKDRNTRFFHDYFPNSHDAYKSVKHGSYIALNLRGRHVRFPVSSNLTESARFLARDVSKWVQNVPKAYELLPSLKRVEFASKCAVLKKGNSKRFRKCRADARRKGRKHQHQNRKSKKRGNGGNNNSNVHHRRSITHPKFMTTSQPRSES